MAIVKKPEDSKVEKGEYPLSYSSQQLLEYGCKRKYQLYKMLNYAPMQEREDTIHTLFGKGVGAAVPILLEDPEALDVARHACFMEWTTEDLFSHINQKSLITALKAVEEFQYYARDLIMRGWRIASLDLGDGKSKPATEVSFKLTVKPYGYYIGYIDVIMYNENLDQYKVVEIKTMQGDYDSNKWQNRTQDVGYLFVGALTGNYTGVTLYPTYLCTKERQYWNMPEYVRGEREFNAFLEALLLSYRTIEYCEEHGYTRSGNCHTFGRECQAFSACWEDIQRVPTLDGSKDTVFDIEVTIDTEDKTLWQR